MPDFFAQPTWPVAVCAVLAAICTAVLSWYLNQKNIKFTQEFQLHSAKLAEQASETSKTLAELKKIEISNATAIRYAEAIEKRAARLHDDFAELLSIPERMKLPSGLTDKEKSEALTLVERISLTVSPRGVFNEELNIQIGHIRESVLQGPAYLSGKANLLIELQLNAWRMIDAEYDRSLETLATGSLIERPTLEPFKTV